MPFDDTKRFEILARLRDVLGSPVAEHVMEYLPPIDWTDVARQSAVKALGTRIDGLEKNINLRIDLLEENINVRFDAARSDMAVRFDALMSNSDVRFAALIDKIESSHRTTRWNIGGLFALVCTPISVVLVR